MAAKDDEEGRLRTVALRNAQSILLARQQAEGLERLIALKRRYDPTNLFRLNHNIPLD
jgi:FAD/FMN-containing dehydrogenase